MNLWIHLWNYPHSLPAQASRIVWIDSVNSPFLYVRKSNYIRIVQPSQTGEEYPLKSNSVLPGTTVTLLLLTWQAQTPHKGPPWKVPNKSHLLRYQGPEMARPFWGTYKSCTGHISAQDLGPVRLLQGRITK